MPRDPYRVLGVTPGVSSEDLHDAYRRLVKLHHPDRNGGSEESARRFIDIVTGPSSAAPVLRRARECLDASVEIDEK